MHKLRLAFALSLCMVCGASISAQSFKKAYKRYKKQDYPAARNAFERNRAHLKYGPAAIYYSNKMDLRSVKSLPRLFAADLDLLKAAEWLQRLPPKTARKLTRKYAVDSAAVLELRREIQRWAIVLTRVSGTFSALDSLLEGLKNPLPDLQPAIDSAHADIVNAQLDSEDYDVMTKIVRAHLRWISPENHRRSRQINQRLWPAFEQKYPLCQLNRFAEDHPGSFVGRDCWRDQLQPLLCRKDAAALLDFRAQTPWTALESVVLNLLTDRPAAEDASLGPEHRRQMADIRLRGALRAKLRSGRALADTSAVLQAAGDYIGRNAPRYSAFRLLEESLQFFLKNKLYHSATLLLTRARPFFPDTLPSSCNTSFDFQLRAKPWIDFKVPLLQRPADRLVRRPLVGPNTPAGDESNPVLTADGKTLYFAGSGRPDNRVGRDVFVAQRLNDSTWSTPALVEALSGKGDQAPLSVTADGLQMLLSVNGRLHLSRREAGSDWSLSAPLPVSGIPQIGKGFLSADGNTLLLEGSYSTGGALTAPDVDLFVSFRDDAGHWSRPEALGSDINGDADEGNPFLTADGRTLYYTSESYPGLGRSDVFMAVRNGTGWTNWTFPFNLGKEVNDVFEHKGFGHVAPGHARAIYTQYAEDGGAGDLWETTLPEGTPQEILERWYKVKPPALRN
jgi:WD40-like Beta Propeller Repeat